MRNKDILAYFTSLFIEKMILRWVCAQDTVAPSEHCDI